MKECNENRSRSVCTMLGRKDLCSVLMHIQGRQRQFTSGPAIMY